MFHESLVYFTLKDESAEMMGTSPLWTPLITVRLLQVLLGLTMCLALVCVGVFDRDGDRGGDSSGGGSGGTSRLGQGTSRLAPSRKALPALLKA